MIRPLLVENVAMPMTGWLSRSRCWPMARRLQRQQDHDEAKIVAKMDQLVATANEQTSFWRDRLAAIQGSQASSLERLAQVKPVSKSELESGFPEQVVSSNANQEDLRFAATRGTTQRMICVHDFEKRDAIRAAMVATLRASGYRIGMRMVEIPPDICDVVCGDLGEQDEGVLSHLWDMARRRNWKNAEAWRDLRGLVERHWIYNRKNYPAFLHHGSNPPEAYLDQYLERLQQDRPHVLKGLTNYLYKIAQRAHARQDFELRIPVIKPLGSGVTPHMRNTIETAFQGKFHDDYGSAELGSIACDCAEGNGMHVFSELFVVEVIDQSGMPVDDGVLGEIVVTDLVNQAMPLFRYRLGDLGSIDRRPCPCGRISPRLKVMGRVQDALLDARGEWIPSFEIAELLYSRPDIDQFQLVEKRRGDLELTVVPQNETVDFDSIQELLHQRLGEARRIRQRTARTIAAEPGGKFRWVKAQPHPTKRETARVH